MLDPWFGGWGLLDVLLQYLVPCLPVSIGVEYFDSIHLSRVHLNRIRFIWVQSTWIVWISMTSISFFCHQLNRADADDVNLIFLPSADRLSKKPGGSTKKIYTIFCFHTSYRQVQVKVCALQSCHGFFYCLITQLLFFGRHCRHLQIRCGW